MTTVADRRTPRGAWWTLRRLEAGEGGAVWSATVGSESLDDDALAALAVADPEAFGVLFRRHVTAVHAFVQRRCRSIDLADDLTAAAFEKAWRALPSFRNGDGGFRPWIFRIAANEMASHYRSESRRGRREQLVAHSESRIGNAPDVAAARSIGRARRARRNSASATKK